MATGPKNRPRASRRKYWWLLVPLVALVLIGAVVANTVLTRRIQDRVGQVMSCRASMSGASVDLIGEPVLLQLVSGHLRASVTIGWEQLGDRMSEKAEGMSGATLGEQDGELAVTLDRQVMGQPLQVLMSVRVDGHSLVLTPDVVVVGQRQIQASLVANFAGDSISKALEPRTLDLDLPDGVSLDSVGVKEDGMTADVTADLGSLPEQKGGSCAG